MSPLQPKAGFFGSQVTAWLAMAAVWALATSWPAGMQKLPAAQVAGKRNFETAVQKVEAQLVPATAKRGETVTWRLTVDLAEGWHTYPTQQGDPKAQPFVTVLKFPDSENVVFVGNVIEPPNPITKPEPTQEIKELRFYEGRVVFERPLIISPSAKPGTIEVPVTLQQLTVCDAKGCLLPKKLALKAPLAISDAPAVPVEARYQEAVAKAAAVTPSPGPVSVPTPVQPSIAPGPKDYKNAAASTLNYGSTEDYQASLDRLLSQLKQPSTGQGATAQAPKSDLWGFLLAGVFWGAVSLITPCVFPMIPITVSFFLKQSEKEHHRPVTMALVYCGTIVVVLTIAAVVLLSLFRLLSVHPVMNTILGVLFVFFALSLFGMYEIELSSKLTITFFLTLVAFGLGYFALQIPGIAGKGAAALLAVVYVAVLYALHLREEGFNLAQFTSAREQKGGFAGTMFMALTFTIISFACVASFLGGFGGTAATAQFSMIERILGGLAFSMTFAAPFFFLALFPTLLKKLPKSGSWLNSVKVVMGFLELAAAVKFFRVAELILLPRPNFFTYDLSMALYVALALFCGLYLLNFYRLPHDSVLEHIGVVRMLFGLVFVGLGLYLAPALFKVGPEGEQQRPTGTIYAWLDSFLLPEPNEDKLWSPNLEQAVADATANLRDKGEKHFIFVDFTGESCTNCKINENTVFRLPEIRELFSKYKMVQLYTDKIPNKFYAPDIRARFGGAADRQREDAHVNLEFQRKGFGTEQLPLYVILEPNSEGRIDIVSVYDEGKINDDTAFAAFLRKPLDGGATATAQAANRP